MFIAPTFGVAVYVYFLWVFTSAVFFVNNLTQTYAPNLSAYFPYSIDSYSPGMKGKLVSLYAQAQASLLVIIDSFFIDFTSFVLRRLIKEFHL